MFSTDTQCPKCGSGRIVFGELTRGRTIGPAEALGFRAFASRLSSLRKGVEMKSAVCACSMCGLVWGHIIPDLLVQQLDRLPTDEAKRWLRSADDTPL